VTLSRLLALAALLCSAALSCQSESPSAGGPLERAQTVETVLATTQEVRVNLQAVGIVRASAKAEIRPEVSGLVAELLYAQGSRVEEGELLVRLDDRKPLARLALAKATLDSARARLRVAEQRLARNRQLIADELVSREEFDSVEAEYLAAEATVREQEAAVTLAERELDDYHLRAPFSGTVGERLVDVGNYVEQGDPLVVLLRTDPIEVEIKVPDKHARQLTTETAVRIESSTEAAPVVGRVSFIDPRVDPSTRMLALRAEAPNPEAALRDGQFVQVTVLVGTRPSQVVIPEEAILFADGKTWVFVVSDGRASRREVAVGERLTPNVEVLSGLAAQETVVVGGQHRLEDGARVEPRSLAPAKGS
jgi:membrane fusion protein (multidrug efflux system)